MYFRVVVLLSFYMECGFSFYFILFMLNAIVNVMILCKDFDVICFVICLMLYALCIVNVMILCNDFDVISTKLVNSANC